MEEVQRSKRRRVYSSEPNVVVYTSFKLKYISYLLPALLEATSDSSSYCGKRDEAKLRQKVRFEVDMALVFSSGGFQWSRALKHKLDQAGCINASVTTLGVLDNGNRHIGIVEEFNWCLRPFLSIPRPIVTVEATRVSRIDSKSCKRELKEEKELGCRVRTLRRIVPGGREMGVCELLSEVETYLVCLKMQVNILRSLVNA